MKKLLCLLLLTAFSGIAHADIQDPPANDYGPTRKLSRAMANIFLPGSEIPSTIATINQREGNSAAVTYGVVKGVGRYFYRVGAGVHELAWFPFPTYKASYRPFYKSSIPYIQGGYDEFPPELGFDTKRPYVRVSTSY
jgi:putative exosortase-associated protein (TIGR04073 family)